MNTSDSKFSEPGTEPGDWVAERETRFWHEDNAYAVKHIVEKMTTTLLSRSSVPANALEYAGASQGGGDHREVWLRFEAVIDSRKLYSLRVRKTAPRRWSTEAAFVNGMDRAFDFWRSKLTLAVEPIARAQASTALFERFRQESIAMEEAAASVVEDPAAIAAVQTEVLNALRSGMLFFTANKEGGTHLKFDGRVFVRSDYGEEPNLHETFADEQGMIDCLRQFFDWESRREVYPHRLPELEVWKFIRSQLIRRNP